MTTQALRPLSQRLANGVAETKGYSGSVLNHWRTSKSQVRRPVITTKDGRRHLSYTNDGGSANAKGLPAVSKEQDNSGDCVGGCYEWTQEDRNRAATQNTATLAAKGCETASPWHSTETLPTGLRTKARAVGVGATDKQWVNQLQTPVTPQAKPVAYDSSRKTYEIGVAYWYEVEGEDNFTPPSTEQREAALAEQIEVHGKGYRARHIKQCRAWETKQTSWKQLTHAIRGATSWVSLDEAPTGTDGVEPAWTPTTPDPMDAVEQASAAYQNRVLVRKILGGLTWKQRQAVELTAKGETLTSSQRDNLQLARRKVAKLG